MVKRMMLLAAVVALTSVPVAAQTPVKAPAKPATTYVPPKTPWGDPDLQGNYTNKYEQGTPFERPAELEGKTLADISDKELADLVAKRQQSTIERDRFISGDPTGTIAGPLEFRDIFEIKKASRAWFVTDPPDGKIPPMTPEARQRIAARRPTGSSFSNGVYDSYESLSLYDRCITRGFPTSGMPTIYGNSSRIVQGPGYIAIQYEMIHETRLIPIDKDPRPHPGRNIHLDMGDSRGHWEGDTLIVETTNFTQRSVYRNANPDTLKITERFTKVAPNKLRWSVTLDDPRTWTKPWTFSMPLTLNDAEPIQLYECHEGNYGLRNILSAARAEERTLSNATKP